MAQRWFNNGVTRLAAGIGSGDLSLTVETGDGALFALDPGDWFALTLEHPPAPTAPEPDQRAREIVYVTAVVGDVFTVTRGEEGTTAAAWVAGDTVENRLTAEDIAGFAPLVHTHAQSEVVDLETDLAAIVSALGGKATPADITAAIAALVGTAPGTLDTLGELSDALADDANLAATLTTLIGTKQPADATLDALAALDGTAGLLEVTALNTFVRRLLGVGASTSVPTRADADARYAGIGAASQVDFLLFSSGKVI